MERRHHVRAAREHDGPELVELKNKIEEEWGITAAAPVAAALGRRRRAPAEEKSTFDVVLTKAGRRRSG